MQGLLLAGTKGATQTFGYEENEINGKPIALLTVETDSDIKLNGFITNQEDKENSLIGKLVEMQGCRKNGEIFPIELSVSQWQTSNDMYTTAIIRDITERKQAELELLRAKRKSD